MIRLKFYVLIVLALVVARAFLRGAGFPKQDVNAWIAAWLGITFAAFFSGHFLVFSGLILVACIALKRLPNSHAALIYIALLPAIPLHSYMLPGFAGIFKIIDLNYDRVLVLFLLIPSWLAYRNVRVAHSGPYRTSSTIDVLFISYCSWAAIHAYTRNYSLTDNFRVMAEVLIFQLAPFLALRLLIDSREALVRAIQTLVVTGAFVAALCTVEQITRQHLYSQIAVSLGLHVDFLNFVQYERFGLLRTNGSIGGGVGFFAVFSMAGLICIWRLRLISTLWFLLGCVLYSLPILFTGSRGTWIMAGLTITAIGGFRYINSIWRLSAVSLIAIFALPRIQRLILGIDDEFGTFKYREALLDSAITMVLEKPILGWGSLIDVLESGRLEHMRQGQGIIDIVNTYLIEALSRGIPGLLLFCGILVGAVISVLGKYKSIDAVTRSSSAPIASCLTGVMLGISFLLVTTSPVGHTMAYIVILAAFSSSFASLPAVPSPTGTSERAAAHSGMSPRS